jgi:hypothetical protein
MDIVIVGIDLGKDSCSLVGLDASGRVVLRRRCGGARWGALSRDPSTTDATRRCRAVISVCDASPVLELAEHAFDEISAFVGPAIHRIGRPA